jgi:hypothetical protein
LLSLSGTALKIDQMIDYKGLFSIAAARPDYTDGTRFASM